VTTRAPAAPAFLIHQTHDASGAPARAEYVRDFPARLLPVRELYDFLATLNLRPTNEPGLFSYADPRVGRGTVHAVGFGYSDAKGIQNYAVMRDIDAAIGIAQPPRWDGSQAVLAHRRLYRNPWIMAGITLAFGLAFLGILIFCAARLSLGVGPYVATDIAAALFSLLFVVVAVIAMFQFVRRIRWWTPARAYALSTGRPVPPDLELFT
jgi:hypothetical protein